MKPSKILFYLILLSVLLIPAIRESTITFVQSAAIYSGMMNASVKERKKEIFNYDFIVRDLSGKEVDFKSFRGKVIFLNLWATWCGPCRSEMPSIQELYNDAKVKDVAFVMLSVDETRKADKVKSYIKEQAFNFPVYTLLGTAPAQLQVDVIPNTFVIDKNGFIVMEEVGMRNYNTQKFKNYLERLTR